jgi:hypothetical protein
MRATRTLAVLVAASFLSAVPAWAKPAKAATTTTTSTTLAASTTVPFSPTGIWNKPLAADAPLSAGSATLVKDLVRQVTTFGSWVNTSQYSTPVYRVPTEQPTVKVTLDAPLTSINNVLATVLGAVPLPASALPSAGTDGHAVIWQPSTDKMWEFWQLRKLADGWHASWGGQMNGTSSNQGIFPWPYGATATGLPMHGGLMLPDEIRAGNIPHALALSIPEATANAFVAPANRTDGTVIGGGIPEGTRFRLPANLDIRSLGLPWTAAVMALAAQRYGIVVRDKAGAVAFYGEDPKSIGSDPWPSLFENRYPDQNGMFAKFPWGKLQVVQP